MKLIIQVANIFVIKIYMNRKVVLYIAMTLDGYIAKPNDDLSFLSIVQAPGEDYGYEAFMSTVDTVLIGRKTYDWVIRNVDHFPHAHLNTYILSKTMSNAIPGIKVFNGDLVSLVQNLKRQEGGNIFCEGGSEIIHSLLLNQLLDELIISIIPILVGDGIPLFKSIRPEQELILIDSKKFKSGLVQLHYTCVNKKGS